MSYSTENILPSGVTVAQVVAFAKLLGYTSGGNLAEPGHPKITYLGYFEEKDYRSWVPVELSVSIHDGAVHAATRTRIGRSHYDFKFQTKTAREIRRRFGGKLVEDGPEWFTPGPAFSPAASGCHLAIGRLDWHLGRIRIFRSKGPLPPTLNNQAAIEKLVPFLREINPEVFLGNLLVPYVVSVVESYLKDSYIALLRYSPRKAAVLKGTRLSGEQLAAISDERLTVEEAVAETMSFQRLSAVGKNFQDLDSKLDFLGVLRKPYRRRKRTLLDDIDGLITKRHDLIHRMTLDVDMDASTVDGIVDDVHAAMNRIHKHLTKHYGWPYEHTSSWPEGGRRKRRSGTEVEPPPTVAAVAPKQS
ncbi:hypothetical protein [Ralstonia pseudosolanacearum]|uniref:hypothetical protein n=1 Tax=Ralstonia pseudosolanacearum TaxID=1310165 RepID=UPI002676DB13|nr:hypothetical protein [Ralstonia pseudosolanacearum]MDO3547175.1 hypothetical protein [Ralstonia pseudosolanacearum]MDO3582003.1 hypothetical protein [Ralstonia pseudosolanacearum]